MEERDNAIIEILSNGERKVQFIPTPAKDTPKPWTLFACGTAKQSKMNAYRL